MKDSKEKSSLVATCNTHRDAEQAVKDLQKSGFNMRKLSIIGKDYHTEEQVTGYYTAGDSMKHVGKFGAFWGGIFGLIAGSAFFFIPGFGPLMIAGSLVSTFVGGLEGAVIGGGVGILFGALASLDIPKDSVLKYETALKADKYLVIAQDSPKQIEQAKKVLSGKSGVKVDVHEPAALAV
jgi:ABC-type antimicrobial peptide transport system permease subunit